MRVVIIENEAQAQETLSNLIAHYCPNLHLVGLASSIAEACNIISKTSPQLIFLDVELDNESGFDLFNHFPSPDFEVIFTTAHQEYALQAIRYSCLDYLLKPIDFRELKQALEKSGNRMNRSRQGQIENLVHNLERKPDSQKIAIPSVEGYDFIMVSSIIMALAQGNYTLIYTMEGQLLSSRTLGEFESLISSAQFFRTHKSYLINWDHLERYNKAENLIHLKKGHKAELASRRKEEFLSRIKHN